MDEVDCEVFNDTFPVLERLYERGFTLGIISDAWPSLERKYRLLDLRKYFKAFVISAQVGCCKPDKRIFGRAIAELELPPEKLLFVDDDPHYVKEAIGLGMYVILMVRSGEPTDVDVEWVRNLEEIEALL